jgi:Ala-tRNA(Pro) deacylase
MDYRGDPQVYSVLKELNIPFEYHEHHEAPTVEIASQFWDGIDSAHCKNLFFRNHKGNKHYLVILEYRKMLNIKQLEKLLKQGKLTFASPKRMLKYLKLTPGSVSPFGLIHDSENHVHLFIDQSLKETQKISFHPNLNTASLVIATKDFFRYLDWTGNSYEFIDYVIE